ncbi:MAG: TlpA family protein disulfide reductase [Sulfurovum sp.]|nr:MAG: TlpA family protein disulfide reductase [Sulfurovum sp.]
MKKLFLTLALAFISTTSILSADDKPLVYTLTTTNNQEITVNDTKEGLDFKEFKGKAVLLTLFGHRCPPCIREIPTFVELTTKHPNDLAIVAIEAQNYPEDEVKEFQEEHKMNYNVIAGINHNDFITYISGRAGYTSGIPLPLLIAIDKHGEVQNVHAGELTLDELESLVKDLNK